MFAGVALGAGLETLFSWGDHSHHVIKHHLPQDKEEAKSLFQEHHLHIVDEHIKNAPEGKQNEWNTEKEKMLNEIGESFHKIKEGTGTPEEKEKHYHNLVHGHWSTVESWLKTHTPGVYQKVMEALKKHHEEKHQEGGKRRRRKSRRGRKTHHKGGKKSKKSKKHHKKSKKHHKKSKKH